MDFIWSEKTFCANVRQTLVYRNCTAPGRQRTNIFAQNTKVCLIFLSNESEDLQSPLSRPEHRWRCNVDCVDCDCEIYFWMKLERKFLMLTFDKVQSLCWRNWHRSCFLSLVKSCQSWLQVRPNLVDLLKLSLFCKKTSTHCAFPTWSINLHHSHQCTSL